MTKEKDIRNSNIELLRIVLMFGIILMHTVGTEVNKSAYIWINVLGNMGVTSFILISGYYGINLRVEKILRLDIRFIVYSLLTLFVLVWGGKEEFGFRVLLMHIMPIISNKSWFLSCYIFLNILSPFLNEYINNLTKNKYKLLLFANIILFLGIPTIFGYDLMGRAGKDLVHIVITYFVGRYIRLWMDKEIRCFKYSKLWLVTICVLNYLLTYSYYSIKGTITIDFYKDNSIFIMAQSILLFCLVKKQSFKHKIINHLAGNVLSVYMLEKFSDFVILLFWDYTLYAGGDLWVLIVVFVVLLKMSIAFIINEIYKLIFGGLENRTVDFWSEKVESGMRFLAQKVTII